LPRQVLPHRVVAVAGEDEVGLHRGRLIGGDRGAHARIGIVGEEVKQLRPHAVMDGDTPALGGIAARREPPRFLIGDPLRPALAEAVVQHPHQKGPLPPPGCRPPRPARPPPHRLAPYMAASARASSSSGLSLRPAIGTARPTEAPSGRAGLPESSASAAQCVRMVAARRSAVASVTPSSHMTNSSPPIRAIKSPLRELSWRIRAISRSAASPAWWPRVSLTSLKLSRWR